LTALENCETMSASQVWGWHSFFSEIQSFLRQVQQVENGHGRQAHVEYGLDGFHAVIFNTTTIRDILSGNPSGAILCPYKEAIDEWLLHLQQGNVHLNVVLTVF